MLHFIQKIILLILTTVLCAGTFVAWQGYEMYENGLERLSMEQMEEEMKARPDYTSLTRMPETYLEGVLAAEDKRFYKHPGVDVLSIGRAVVNDIRAGALVEGGSTITQQLAKNIYFSQEKRFSRKIAEVFMAVEIEKHFSKDEILEMYLNSIYFGNGYNGAQEASWGYFGKDIAELTQEECIMLAGIPNAPSVYNPVDNPTLALQRQQQVRTQMVKAGYLKEVEVVPEM